MLKYIWSLLFPPPRDPEDGVLVVGMLNSLREAEGLSRVSHDQDLSDIADSLALRAYAGQSIDNDIIITRLLRAGRSGWLFGLSVVTRQPGTAMDHLDELAATWHNLTDDKNWTQAGAARRGDCWILMMTEHKKNQDGKD